MFVDDQNIEHSLEVKVVVGRRCVSCGGCDSLLGPNIWHHPTIFLTCEAQLRINVTSSLEEII